MMALSVGDHPEGMGDMRVGKPLAEALGHRLVGECPADPESGRSLVDGHVQPLLTARARACRATG
jgi:hypothetical protein